MRYVNPLTLLREYLEKGYDVLYIDADGENRGIAKMLWKDKKLLVQDYKPYASSSHHRDITIAVNPDLSPGAYKDWMAASYTNIYIYLPGKQ